MKIMRSFAICAALVLCVCFAACSSDDDGLLNMVEIKGGSFSMGSPGDEDGRFADEGQHAVKINKFYIAKYPVTQELYEAVTLTNPSLHKSESTAPTGETWIQRPVERVTWFDALNFCNKLSDKEGYDKVYTITSITMVEGSITHATVEVNWAKNGYRLPTEAEWEYACRAGTKTAYFTGSSMVIDEVGWYASNSETKTHQVGLKRANKWGVYDMVGNVYEWCWDWYGSYSTQGTNPKGPDSGAKRVMRGGAYNTAGDNEAIYSRSAFRFYIEPETSRSDIGFRVACNEKPKDNSGFWWDQ